MKEEVFIPLESFSISQRYSPKFGIFYALRCLFSIRATGGRTCQRVAFYSSFYLLLAPVAVVIDLFTLAVYALYLVCKKLVELVYAAVVLLLETVIKKFLGVVLVLAAVVLTTLTIYVKWHDILAYIKALY